MAFLYFLYSDRDQKWYIGQTMHQVAQRYALHCAGKVRSTKHRRPLRLAYYEELPSRQKVLQREWFLKHPKGYKEKRMITKLLLQSQEQWPLIGPLLMSEPALG